ncbi:hypothetical protein FN846DRAFT_779885 [Sphaerosporella brunnea]|uniref:PIN domain-like protein n=1 Tax=Sphaerosporella brunnea TaxID=1250544 RepID=A0A5J5ETW8_9PEZI|nr:hypothetical protein FN846DRAFT_779885 [Sphaerosporella brunnea]
MGVHGLWTIIEPAHRPVKLETLARKRLAVDASIWIYQFLKAVRDSEGDALQNSHIVGFFRRICKLLFHGIRPVFVFDGGAPVLKRQTIAGRKKRREDRREDAAQTARKLLALQVKRRAQEEADAGRGYRITGTGENEEIPENVVYVDQLEQTLEQRKHAELQRKRRYKKTDQYQLPEMEHDFSELGANNDHRLLTAEELQEYAKQFEGMEDTNLNDYSNIDFSSPFFAALPDADRYRILNQARIRSRLRMGYSKEQLEAMFPDRMAFSKFQIERVARRNELSQRLMNLQGRDSDFVIGRVAGEKNKEYVMVRNEKEGGWAMTFVGNKGELEGEKSKPIDVENLGKPEAKEEETEDDDADFEDVPIEGLNRLPKAPPTLPPALAHLQNDEAAQLRRALYESRMEASGWNPTAKPKAPKSDALFLEDDSYLGDMDDVLFGTEDDLQVEEDLQKAIAMSMASRGFRPVDNDDEDLQRAIAMSMSMSQEPAIGNGKGKGKAMETPDDWDMTDGEDAEFRQAIADSSSSNNPRSKLPAKLDLSNSTSTLTLGKKLAAAEAAAARPKPEDEKKEEAPKELPPWFAGGGIRDIMAEVEQANVQTIREHHEHHEYRMAVQGADNVVALLSDEDSDVEFIDVNGNELQSTPERVKSTSDARKAPASPRPQQVPITIAVPDGSGDELPWSESEDEPAPAKDAHPPSPKATKQASPIPGGQSPPPPLDEEPDDFDLAFGRDAPTPPPEITPEDAEEGELLEQLQQEAAEYARFAAELALPVPPTANDNNRAQNLLDYEAELKSLRTQQKKDRRDADEVTQVMIQECQQLLTLFGLPYITAPMEAEAQCAELVKLGLVDGIVTDDSDVFLFGGTRVYRYMFNDKQTVQCYLLSDLEKELSLDQHRLIAAAQLLGSDYTDGIPGIGPVSAIELLAEFAASGGLASFKAWWARVQSGTETPADLAAASKFRKKFKRQNAAKIFLPPSFPDPQVKEAYLKPEVDSDPSAFEWGVPDLEGLRAFLMNTLGWSREYTDRTLVPVVRDMNKKLVEGSQVNITDFFSGTVGTGAFAPRVRAQGKSARLEKAVELLRKKDGGAVAGTEATAVKRPMSMREKFAEMGEVVPEEAEEQQAEPPKKKRKAPAKRGRGSGRK